jgi:NCAIR mutase (PurE)-related protein
MTDTRDILEDLAKGKITVDQAMQRLRVLSLDVVEGLAVLDADRLTRNGVPEVILAETKSPEEIMKIAVKMLENSGFALITRLVSEKLKHIKRVVSGNRIVEFGRDPHITALIHEEGWSPPETGARIGIITAGTSDIPYAEEARATAHVMGVETLSFHDVGVAGIHRLIEPLKKIIENDVDAIVVFAGMEGALPTVVAALLDIPVIGVPVPVGYGFGGGGETALASMLQSCAPGLAVVNIGNGFGGAAMAALIAVRAAKKRGA